MPDGEQPAAKRELLVSRTWLQVAGLVIIAGFFVLGPARLSAPTSPIRRSPTASSIPSGRVRLHRRRHPRRARRSSCTTASWSTARSSATAPTSGPDFTADYLHRSSAIGPRSARRRAAPTPRASRRSTSSRPTATTPTPRRSRSPPSRRRAFGQLERTTRDLFDSPTPPDTGCCPSPVNDPEQIHQLTAFFAWSSWAASARRPGPQLLLHEQLAARAAGRQRTERRRDRLVGDLADRAARRDRGPVRRIRALEAGLAGARPGDAQLPRARRRGADSGASGPPPGSSS